MKTAVLLCGGRGSRMGSLTEKYPKPLVEVHGKPILWYIFWTLYSHGFRKFILPVGYRGELLTQYMGLLTEGLDCQLICQDTGIDSSIAERVHLILDHLDENQDFFLLNSDTIFDFDIEEMYRLHIEKNALLTLSSVEIISNWGLIIMKNQRVSGFERERKVRHLLLDSAPEHYGLVNSGMAWLNKSAFSQIDLLDCNDFESDLYQQLIDMNRAEHYQIKGVWFPIDTPKDLNIINLNIEDKHSSGNLAISVKERLVDVDLSSRKR